MDDANEANQEGRSHTITHHVVVVVVEDNGSENMDQEKKPAAQLVVEPIQEQPTIRHGSSSEEEDQCTTELVGVGSTPKEDDQVNLPKDKCASTTGAGYISASASASASRYMDGSKKDEVGEALTYSMLLRRLPVDILLQPSLDFDGLSDVGERDNELDESGAGERFNELEESAVAANSPATIRRGRRWFHDLFLSPTYPLKVQLMLSFGSVNFCTTAMVIIICISVSYYVGESVKKINQEAFEQQLVPDIQALTLRYLAESLEQQFLPLDLVDIIEEAVQDRFQGYPNSILWSSENNDDSSSAPPLFRDMNTGRNIYPIVGDPMFLDWQIPADVTEDNYLEHVTMASRWEGFLQKLPAVSTKSAVFYYQGVCDPNATSDSESWFYSPNCTAANNNITAGGAIHPVPTLEPIYRASSDILPLFKAIYETTPEIRELGLYFASMGAGASFHFPAYPLNGQSYFTSVGCDWMATPNPMDPTLGPIGTPEEISRCHTKGESVSTREYNPLEREWCRDQALNPHKTQISTFKDALNDQEWQLSVGRAIYDRKTNAFVTCIYIGMSLSSVEVTLRESLLTNHSALSLVRFDVNGTVMASTMSSSLTDDNSRTVIDQLDVGLSKASYQKLYALIQSSLNETSWDPEAVREKLSSIRDNPKYLVAVSPMPRIPETYDPKYQPEFLVVMSTSTADVFEGVRKLDDAVDADVKYIILYSLIVGIIGLAVAALMIILMTKTLTAPLRYINDAADGIVKGFGHTRISENDYAVIVDDGGGGDEDKEDDDDDKAAISMEEAATKAGIQNAATTTETFASRIICSPKTELNDVLEEFNIVVANFAGSKMAKSEKGKRLEVRNSFNLRAEFKDLYLSRKSSDFMYKIDFVVDAEGREEGSTNNDDDTQSTMGLIHLGSNIETPLRSKSESKNKSDNKRGKQFSSRLFLWTVALIATPLLLTTIVIAAVVMTTMTTGFGESLKEAKAYFIDVKLDALSVHAYLRADLVGRLTAVPARDAYFLTRYFGWLLFGGLTRADSYTELLSGVGPCKSYAPEDITECPYYKEHYACDCAWNDVSGDQCQDYPGGSRHLQLTNIVVSASDALPDGDRNATSFPKIDTSPETTLWWEDMKTVPGWEKGSSSTGHDFLYDRLRAVSAMPLFPVLYNYDKQKKIFIGQHAAFEADGMFLGYEGCRDSLYPRAAWQSTESNGASKLRPELCPIGKYGYDPRCRGWYDTGRKLATEQNISMHITAPYAFSTGGVVGQSVTYPLVDPRSGEYVGMSLFDFYSNTILGALESKSTRLAEGGFPILIAVQGSPEENTVLGPGYKIGDDTTEISRLVLRNDYACGSAVCEGRIRDFSDIILSMRVGDSGTRNFTRESENGGEELIHVSYGPVKVKGIRSIDSSDFARGVEVVEYGIYSLGLCEADDALLQPFKKIESDIETAITWAVGCIAAGIFFGALFVFFISYRVTMSITEPMLNLLELIRCINRADFDGEPPIIDYSKGSREITKVSDAVLVLYKIVRAANDVFFAGELEIAYVVMVDALKVFKQLGNKKAIAVASNNLGNIMLSMYIEMKALGLRKRCGLTKKEIIARGTVHFHEAITLGETAYDEFYVAEGWTPNCLDFMQHLANRYFNRALFLLTVKDDHKHSEEIVKLGTRDLEIARDMVLEVIAYGEDAGFNRENRSHKEFQIFLNHARGHNMLLEMGYPDAEMAEKGYPDDWELGAKLDETFKLLRKENARKSSELFNEVNVLGRLQDIECVIMKHKQLTGDLDTAARIAIRMLYEDAFVFVEALSTAVDTLLAYVDTKMDLEMITRTRVKEGLLNCSKLVDEVLESVDGGETPSSTLALTLESLSESAALRMTRLSRPAELPGFNKVKSNWVRKRFFGGIVTMEDF